MKAELRDGRLVLSDQRMGTEPDYIFRFAVAARRVRLARDPARAVAPAAVDSHGLDALWDRLWREPGTEAHASKH